MMQIRKGESCALRYSYSTPRWAVAQGWLCAAGSVLNGGRLLEVTRDGQDFSVRIPGDRIEVPELVDGKSNEASVQSDLAPVERAKQESGRPDPGRYVQPVSDGSVQFQRELADRGGRIALLNILNEAAGNPYSFDEIQRTATDRIDVVRDWLIEQGRASESRMETELDKVPGGVQSRLNVALKGLRDIRDRLAGVERARGKGEILALEVRDVQEDVARYQDTIDEFREKSQGNNVDADLVIRALGGVPDLSSFGEPAAADAYRAESVRSQQASAADAPTPSSVADAEAAEAQQAAASDAAGLLREERQAAGKAERVSQWRGQFVGTPAEQIASGDIARSDYEKLAELVSTGRLPTARAAEMVDSAVDADVLDAKVGEYIKSKIPAAPSLTGARRTPTQVNAFSPYQAGDIVTIDGKDWQVQQDMGGWYLTDNGNWRGMHPTIQKIKGMNELIAEVEQAAVSQEVATEAVPTETGAEASDLLTPDQAIEQMEWRDGGQRDGEHRHTLVFREGEGDRNGFTVATLRKYNKGQWTLDDADLSGEIETFKGLREAKKAAQARALKYLEREGYVAAESQTAAEVTATAETSEETPSQQPQAQDGVVPDQIGDKLEGSRRDRAAIQAMTEALTDEQIESLPLSKIWPANEIDKIEDKFAAAVSFAARAEIPPKPRKAYKVAGWVQKVKTLRNEVVGNMLATMERDAFLSELRKYGSSLKGFAAKVALLESVDRSQWGRIGKVGEYPDAYTYEDGQRVEKPYVYVEVDGRPEYFYGSTSVADVVEQVAAKLDGSTVGSKRMAFEVRGRPGSYFINKKGDSEYRRLKTFTDAKEAIAYRISNYNDLVAEWEKVKERDNVRKDDVRREENRERSGRDWRQGRDVDGNAFVDEFGFRGVEFGNWVEQGKNAKERQGMLNLAYDALMDLAEILGIPPKAISLNGSLGLAFGSRGSGKASAHFEPGNLVINLTKTRGAGALAHEFFHALDNYFSRQRGGEVSIQRGLNAQQAYRTSNYITYRPEPMYVHKTEVSTPLTQARLKRIHEANPTARYYNPENWQRDPNHPQGVRVEVERAFAELVEALDESPMKARSAKNDKGEDGYWSRIIERGARAFENYVIHKMQQEGYQNDYLANVRSIEEFARNPERFPYLLPEEVAPVAEAFDNLFSTIETRETDQGVALFRSASDPNTGAEGVVSVADANATIEGFVETYPGAPEMEVFASFADLPLEIQQAAKNQGSTETSTKGVFKHGKVYLVAGNHTSIADFEATVFHETLGHDGIRGLLGDDFLQKINQLYVALGGQGGLVKIMKARGLGDTMQEYIQGVLKAQEMDATAFREAMAKGDPKAKRIWTDAMARAVLTEEVFSHIAEQQGARPKLMDRMKALIGLIRQWLRDHKLFNLSEMGETDLLHMLNRARAQMKGPRGDGPRGSGMPGVGSFAGERAQTADRMALSAAQERIAAGERAETVRQETGWFQANDGKWKFEINDRDAFTKGTGTFGGEIMRWYRAGVERTGDQLYKTTVGDMIYHPALFAAYPQLANIEVQMMPKGVEADARVVHAEGEAPIIQVNEGLPKERWLSVMLHELQHGIQTIEGFATGGSARTFARQVAEADSMIAAHNRNMRRISQELDAARADRNEAAVKRLQAEYDRSMALRSELVEKAQQDPFQQYHRLAGEVEARNVQARQRMTDAERQATPPSQTADVADSDVIVVFNGEEMHSAPPPANAQTGRVRKSRVVKDNQRAALFTALARFDDAFQHPTPKATTVEAIAREIDPEYRAKPLPAAQVKARGKGRATKAWEISVPESDVRVGYLFEDGRGRVWVDVHLLRPRVDSGNTIYSIAAGYAHNAGKVFIGDPEGLSPIALFRRLENMISSALRYGTTDHLYPHAAQVDPQGYYTHVQEYPDFAEQARGLGLDWRDGDFAHNLTEMLRASYDAATRFAPELKNVIYDFESRQFVDARTGERRAFEAQQELARRLGGQVPARYLAGSATQKRAALINTLARGQGPEAWRAVLAGLVEQLRGRGLDYELSEIFYRKTDTPTETGLSAESFRAALVERFGEEGVTALESNGLLNIVSAEEGSPGNPAWYVDGKAFFVPEYHENAQDAVASVLHEIGEHFGLEGMLGERGWRTLKARVARLASEGNPEIRAVWDGVLDKYAEFDDVPASNLINNDKFMHEVIAKLGERAAGRKSSIWRDLLAAVNRFLLKMGIGRQINKNEIADLVEGSLKRVMQGQMPESVPGGRMDSQSAMKDIAANIRRGQQALAKAITEKTSVHRAMFRNGIGWVDFVWGDAGCVRSSRLAGPKERWVSLTLLKQGSARTG